MTPAHQPAAISSLAARLSVAVRQGELELHFQPAIDMSTGAVGDMEALIRWAHPDRGLLWPAEFLPAAEQSGLLLPLGQWVLERAAAEAAQWPTGHRCWINASALELADPTYPGRVGATIAAVGLPRGALGIDLPEHALAAMGEAAAAVCQALRAVGAALALEHAGVGRRLETPLANLGIDHIKMGRSLVCGIDTDEARRDHVSATVRAAQAMGATLAAVGVESWPEAATLVELGVSAGHGFLFSPPQRADRTRWLLTRGAAARGSFLHDGAGRLQAGRCAAGLRGVLPQGADPGTPTASAAFTRTVTIARPVPAVERVPLPATLRFAPLNGAGNVHPIGGHDPFGRHGARRPR